MRLFRRKAKSLTMEKYGKIVTAKLDDSTSIYLDRPNEIVVRRSRNGNSDNVLVITGVSNKTWSRIEKYLLSLAEGPEEFNKIEYNKYEGKFLQTFIAGHTSNRGYH